MADRRLSRANWSTKNISKSAPYTAPQRSKQFLQIPGLPPVGESTIAEEDEEEDGANNTANGSISGISTRTQGSRLRRVTTSRPHRVDNSNANRRFSVKPPSAAEVAPLTGVPPLPKFARRMVQNNAAIPERQDFKQVISSPDYDASKYLKSQLQNADAATIDAFSTKLSKLSLDTKEEVKNAISQSLKSVLDVSNSVASAQESLQGMKKVISELHDSVYQQMEDAQEILDEETQKGNKDVVNSKKANRRRSVVILEKQWGLSMNKLFEEVDNAQQFVSASPGRHVVAESRRWGELNAITWKPIRPAHIIILNDHLLVATRRKIDDKKRTIATGCWPLRDVMLTDTVTSPASHDDDDSYTIAFKTRTTSLLFQTDSQNEYNKIRVAFKKAKKDQIHVRETDEMRNRSIRKSISRLSSDKYGNVDAMHDLSNQLTHRRARSRDVNQRSTAEYFKSIDENLTNVEIYLGHHKFEQCVGFINRLHEQLLSLEKTAKSGTEPGEAGQLTFLIKVRQMKLDELTHRLVEWLKWEISDPINSVSRIADLIDLFRNLDIGSQGRSALLDSKTKQLDELVSSVKFGGDLRSYILQIAILYFSFIKQVYEQYEKCFSDTKDKSYIIEWINERITSYIEIFKRQLIDYDQKSSTYQNCVTITKQQTEPLKKLGLNVDYLLDI